MAKQSSTIQDRSVLHGARLSLPMQDLLGAVIRAFDARRLMVNAAALGENEYHPETCNACTGTGFSLVPNEVETSDSEDEAVKAEEGEGMIPASPPSPAAEAPAGNTTSGATAGANAVSGATAGGVPSASLTAALAALGFQATPVAAPVVNVVPEPTYPISTVVPGFHSLGPNSGTPVPPPEPTRAVFTGPGADRYYVITKGVRVGVFGGWQITSPYVTGVAAASYSRHRTLQAAYQAYETAYNRGSVVYV
ncbi:hypothetical protein DFP72DRAFT_1073459 [Ephemerocybe angulata]|uniref:Ribonuclease H1 N-terminal domain-containing protein n=1 Tax=Ephemerocybe angulata TaxID=980116 RepID=A0A8H6HBD8_9AGAR|nr:hypothetical protein DFP72DRAFT_1083915 [Tulosesus angulatus]KAF6743096.1 hypothetical protein DFP72DRAFT_859582 [Tulosesus angulatus]KAF6744515.1 hypothetical protein DFP72DRAFT_857513 [Tulosesus angulatus]KAF6749343.1 hypothetical protein DFP72DRAFT_1073459 [Tulosesus angulatus]